MFGDEKIHVAAVCGNQVRIYGELVAGKRRFLKKMEFAHYGAAKQFADEFEEAQRNPKSQALR